MAEETILQPKADDPDNEQALRIFINDWFFWKARDRKTKALIWTEDLVTDIVDLIQAWDKSKRNKMMVGKRRAFQRVWGRK